jgi:hypothetical protein
MVVSTRRPTAIARKHSADGNCYAEAFELSGYGRQVAADELAGLLIPESGNDRPSS